MAAELEERDMARVPGAEVLFGEEALRQLDAYCWPGNVRELRNAVERSVLHAECVGGKIRVERLELNPFASSALSSAPRQGTVSSGPETQTELLPADFSLHEELARREREFLQRALKQARYRQTEAARLLGLTYHQFRALYRKYEALEKGKK